MLSSNLTLENLKIASPCAVRWEDMNGDERVRYCSMCELNVFNVSDMTRDEAQSFLRANSDKPNCMRFFRRKDGTILTKDCPIGERLALRFRQKLNAAVALLVCFLNALPVIAQNQSTNAVEKTKPTSTKTDSNTNADNKPKNDSLFLEPVVLEERGMPMGRERVQKKSPTLPEGAQADLDNATCDLQQQEGSTSSAQSAKSKDSEAEKSSSRKKQKQKIEKKPKLQH